MFKQNILSKREPSNRRITFYENGGQVFAVGRCNMLLRLNEVKLYVKNQFTECLYDLIIDRVD